MKRYECVLFQTKATRTDVVITNDTSFRAGSVVRIKGVDWLVKLALPADTDHLQFGDIIHESKSK